jgi:hypothetical protein
MIDRGYNKIIILCYPRGSGGNFLINCLSLTDQCVFRDSLLAEKQLTSGFVTADKLNYLHTQLNTSVINKKWNDLGLGCANLFGVPNEFYLTEYPEIIQKQFNYVINDLIKSEKYLFLVAHSIQQLDAYFKFWSNAKVIFLTDYREFIKQRGYSKKVAIPALRRYWNIIRTESWQAEPPSTIDEFHQLPKLIQDELIEQHRGEIFKWIETPPTKHELHDREVNRYIERLGKVAHTWSVAKTFSGDDRVFFNELSQCAKWADISLQVSETDILGYYKNWLHTIFVINPSVAQV